jgi:hypothetical protein
MSTEHYNIIITIAFGNLNDFSTHSGSMHLFVIYFNFTIYISHSVQIEFYATLKINTTICYFFSVLVFNFICINVPRS